MQDRGEGEVLLIRVRAHLVERYEVLVPTYVPAKLPHREDMIVEISQLLGRAIYGSIPPDLVITGLSGSGKTATIKRVITDLQKRGGHVQTAYTIATGGAYRTLQQLAAECGIGLEKRGISFEEGWQKFDHMLKGSPRIFILDEMDQTLRKGGELLLYYLSRRPNTCIIGISNRINVLQLINDERVRSSFNPRTMYFPPYNAKQLADILRDRVRIAKAKIEPAAVNLCAALAVGGERKRGDARYALDLLNFAIDVAERARANRVREEHVRIAEKEVETEQVRRALLAMEPPEMRLLLLSIGPNPIPISEAYKITNERARNSEKYRVYSNRRLSNFLHTLEEYGFVRIEHGGKKPRGSVFTVKVSEDLNYDLIKSMIESIF